MIRRIKLLIGIVQEMGGNLADCDLQTLLFIFCNEFSENNHYYHFLPLKNGPYSIQAEEDKNYLIYKNYIEKSDSWIVKEELERFACQLDLFEKMAIQRLKNTWSGKFLELRQHIQQNYPYYSNEKVQPINDESILYTIGYEGVSPEEYINKLIQNDVRLLCDVRKNPISKKYGFSKGDLGKSLALVEIEYLHMPELGIASEKRQNLKSEFDYKKLFDEYDQEIISRQEPKLEELERLVNEKQRIAITCFEADVGHCHRGQVAAALKRRESFTYPVRNL